MNANELINKLKLVRCMAGDGQVLNEAEAMILQQQAEIEALKAHPVKELHLSLQKDKETGELLAVTYTDDEHRIVEVLWQRPPVKELTDLELLKMIGEKFTRFGFEGDYVVEDSELVDFARAILKKAQNG